MNMPSWHLTSRQQVIKTSWTIKLTQCGWIPTSWGSQVTTSWLTIVVYHIVSSNSSSSSIRAFCYLSGTEYERHDSTINYRGRSSLFLLKRGDWMSPVLSWNGKTESDARRVARQFRVNKPFPSQFNGKPSNRTDPSQTHSPPDRHLH